jgi:poly-gamma-glutamate synthesis protein (capsule biosynthesis protein)
MFLVGDWAPGNKQVEMAQASTFVLANLEGPILPRTHSVMAALKVGPSLFCCELPNGAQKFVFSLANNHTMDYGDEGLEVTLRLLEQRGFKACGAGKDIDDARRSIVVEDNGVKIGIIACCEAQFGVARRKVAGVAEFGPWIYQAIRDMCQTVDAVVVSTHAAVEDSPWPSPFIRELYRSFVDAGATVVHGHHSHVPQGYEVYGEGVIFYGMGNFAVDPNRWRNYPNGLWSLAAEIDVRSRPVRWRLVMLEIRHQSGSDTMVIEESSSEERMGRGRYLEICNRPFGDDILFEALWQEVALRAYWHYGASYIGFSSPFRDGYRALIKKSLSRIGCALLNKSSVSQTDRYNLMLRYNMIACESHRQMLATALGVLAGEIEDLRTNETRRLADEMMPWSSGVVST